MRRVKQFKNILQETWGDEYEVQEKPTIVSWQTITT